MSGQATTPVSAVPFTFLVIDGIFRLTFIEARTACRWEPITGAMGPSSAEKGNLDGRHDTDEMRSRQTCPTRTASPIRNFAHRLHIRLPPIITLLDDARLVISL